MRVIENALYVKLRTIMEGRIIIRIKIQMLRCNIVLK